MPGRQSTGAPSSRKPSTKPKKKTQKRTLNALAIAEHENPSRTKIRKHRLGETEDDGNAKRKRDVSDEDSKDEHGESSRVKRRRPSRKDRFGNDVEVGSDSEGNEWIFGQESGEDDSDLDSDEAMGESDEEKFEAFTFRGSSSMKTSRVKRRKSQADESVDGPDAEINLDEEEGQDSGLGEEGDSLGEEAIDLATALDQSAEDVVVEGDRDRSNGRQEDFSGFSSEDEATDNEASEDDEDSALSISEDDDDDDGEVQSAKFASLQNLISSMNPEDDTRPSRSLGSAQEQAVPSEFGLSSNQKLTIDDLRDSITDPALKKSLKLLADSGLKTSSKRNGIPKKLDVPLPKRQQDRLDRAAAYDKSKETLSRWIDTVKHNRRAEHLSFPLQDPNEVANKGANYMLPTSQSKPLTDLESTVKRLLEESGLAGPNGKLDEDFAELPANRKSIEDIQAEMTEKRRKREAISRVNKDASRIKKIKSKSYRRVHRKERERNAQQERDALAAAGIDNSEEEQERNDRRRAEERMGSRHREGKWAKGVKDSGRAMWDEDVRGGVTEMSARREEALKRRIEGKSTVDGSDGSESESQSGSEDEEDDVDDPDMQHKKKLSRQLQEFDERNTEASRTETVLSSMKFMKNAEARAREQNDTDLARLRREAAGEESSSEEEAAEGPGRRSYGPRSEKRDARKQIPYVERSEFEEREGSDEEDKILLDNLAGNETEIIVDDTQPSKSVKSKSRFTARPNHSRKPLLESHNGIQVEENPWLSTSNKKTNHHKAKATDAHAPAIISNLTALDAPLLSSVKIVPKPRSTLKGGRAAVMSETTTSILDVPASDSGSEDEQTPKSNPNTLSNLSLIHAAFAGDSVLPTFNAEKTALADSEAPQTIDTTLPGWGSWIGSGISAHQASRNQNRFSSTTPGIELSRRKDRKLENVIVNEKRVKKNGKYLAGQLPFPFETRAQYERSLRLPVGPEWTTKVAGQDMTRPRVIVKKGVVVAPMARPML